MDPSNMLGAARSAMPINFVDVLKTPVVILRLISLLTSIIVFGCISSGCRNHLHVCIYNGNTNACNFAVGIGVLAFLIVLGLLGSDFLFDRITNVKRRKHIVLGDLALSGFWTFLWFVSFCLLASKWTSTSEKWLHTNKFVSWQESNARSAIAFSFASIGVWGGITFFALRRFRGGGAADTAQGTPDLPAGAGDPYQQQQFGGREGSIPNAGNEYGQPVGAGMQQDYSAGGGANQSDAAGTNQYYQTGY